MGVAAVAVGRPQGTSSGNSAGSRLPPELEGDERLKNIEPRMVEMILHEVCDTRHMLNSTELQFTKQ